MDLTTTEVGEAAAAGGHPLPDRSHGPVGGLLGLVVAVASVTGLVLALGPGARSWAGLLDDNVLNNAVDGVVLGFVGGSLRLLRPRNPIGWVVMYAGAASALSILGEGWALTAYRHQLPGLEAAAWVASWIWATAILLGATVLPAIYPDGRPVDGFARWAARLGWGASLTVGLALSLLDDTYRAVVPGADLTENPVSRGHLQGAATVAAVVGAVVGVLTVLATLVWLLRRLRRAASPEREQLAWLVLAVLPSVLGGLVAPPPVMFGVTLLTSLALVIGIVRADLFDIKPVLRSGLVYGVLVTCGLLGYVLLVQLVARAVPGDMAPRAFAAAAVALALAPAHGWLRRAAGRLVYGDRDDHARALGRLGEGLTDGAAGGELDGVLAAVSRAVRSPGVAVFDAGSTAVAAYGRLDDGPLHEVPLSHGGERVGTLVVAARTPADPVSARDSRLLDVLAVPVAAALHAAALAEEVAASRSRLVSLRAEERRRLRDDLHDGIGPSLSGVALGIEAAMRAGDGHRVQEILGVVHGEVNGLVRGVRRLIDDLGEGPDQGLAGALRARADTVNVLGGVQVRVRLDEVDLPPEVESALYRIAEEAVTNVVRHADAESCQVRVEHRDGAVVLQVGDDGRGVGSSPAGVGRSSMRERARAVGGEYHLGPRPGGGTLLTVTVPVGERDD